MKKIFSIIAIALVLQVTFVCCKHDPEGLDTVPPICFDNQIQPIFSGKCNMTGCHGGNGEGYSFTSYYGIMNGITAGDPNNSAIYRAVTTKWGIIMPPKGNSPLSEEQRTLIYVWIKQGAKETKCN